MDLTNLEREIISKIKVRYGVKLEEAQEHQILNVVSEIIMEKIVDKWYNTKEKYSNVKNAYYLSAEYLMGRTLTNNLINLNIYNEVKNILNNYKVSSCDPISIYKKDLYNKMVDNNDCKKCKYYKFRD